MKNRIMPSIFLLALLFLFACSSYSYSKKYDEEKEEEISRPQSQPIEIEEIKTQAITHIPSYVIDLNINPEEMRVSGVLSVDFVNTSTYALHNIYFNIPLNSFSPNATISPFLPNLKEAVFPHGHFYGYIGITAAIGNLRALDFTLYENLLRVYLQSPLYQGEAIEIGLSFEAQIPKIAHRTGGNDNAIWLGSFLPRLSVLGEGGWHNYSFLPVGNPFKTQTSNFLVNITTPPNYIVASAGSSFSIQREFSETTTIESHFSRDLAFAILGDAYIAASTTSPRGANITLFHTTGDADDFEEILNLSKEAFDHFSERIGANPQSIFKIIQVDLFAPISIKYPGLTFVDERLLFSNAFPIVLVQDIGHQWFYNVVGNNPVAEPWLAYGLVNYLALGFLFDGNQEQISKHARQVYENLQNSLDYMEHSRLGMGLSDYQSWQHFQNIQINRGMLLFYSLEQKMGSESFTAFLKKYYQTFAFEIATVEVMRAVAEEVFSYCLKDFFEEWINSKGLPEIFF